MEAWAESGSGSETWVGSFVSTLDESVDLGSVIGVEGVGEVGGFKSSYLQKKCYLNVISFSILFTALGNVVKYIRKGTYDV